MQLDLIALGEREAETAVRMAFGENLSMYDATSLALADILGTRVVYADENFYKRLSGERRR